MEILTTASTMTLLLSRFVLVAALGTNRANVRNAGQANVRWTPSARKKNKNYEDNMALIEPECQLWGEEFFPEKIKKIKNIIITGITEPGEIQLKGLYKNKPSPYGSCNIIVPIDIPNAQRIEWMADFIKKNKKMFKKAGATNIIYCLYWTGLQGNMEFHSKEIKKIAKLNIDFCIDYLQEDNIESYRRPKDNE